MRATSGLPERRQDRAEHAFCARGAVHHMIGHSGWVPHGISTGADEAATPRFGSKVEGWPRCDGGAACDHLRVPCTVLIVDDHDGFRSFAKALLEAEGFEVAGDAASALDAVARLRPGVVVLDIQLPGADGFEVAARLATTPHPPQVVLVS